MPLGAWLEPHPSGLRVRSGGKSRRSGPSEHMQVAGALSIHPVIYRTTGGRRVWHGACWGIEHAGKRHYLPRPASQQYRCSRCTSSDSGATAERAGARASQLQSHH